MRLILFTVIILIMTSCGVNKVSPTEDRGSSRPMNTRNPALVGIKSSGSANEDEFIANIEANDGKTIPLKITAPEKPKPVITVYDTVQAFAVQLKAFTEEKAASDVVHELSGGEADSVFYYKEGQLYKVRIGPYSTRVEADQKRNFYKTSSFPGAWVAPHYIISSRNMTESVSEAEEAIPVIKTDTSREGLFFIQVASASERSYAEEFLIRNSSVGGYKPEIFKKNNHFKIVVGPFENRNEAQKVLTKIRTDFPDAWIINK